MYELLFENSIGDLFSPLGANPWMRFTRTIVPKVWFSQPISVESNSVTLMHSLDIQNPHYAFASNRRSTHGTDLTHYHNPPTASSHANIMSRSKTLQTQANQYI